MSLALKTKVNRTIEVKGLILATSEALRELLNLDATPSINAEEFRNGCWHPLRAAYRELSSKSPLLALSIDDEPGSACISIYERTRHNFSESDWNDEELGNVASIEVCGRRTGLGIALVAAVAIALARESNSLIVDEANLYTTIDSSAEKFLALTRVTATFSDYRSAADYFKSHILLSSKFTNKDERVN